jgi:hypothetical protein
LELNASATSRQISETVKQNFDNMATLDNALITLLRELAGDDPSKRLRVETPDGKLSVVWKTQLNYLRNIRTNLPYPRSNLGGLLGQNPLQLYNKLVTILRNARTIHVAYKKYIEMTKRIPEVLNSNQYVKNIIEDSDMEFAILLGAQ